MDIKDGVFVDNVVGVVTVIEIFKIVLSFNLVFLSDENG